MKQSSGKAKTFSRVRVTQVIRDQYLYKITAKREMEQYIEWMKTSDEKEMYSNLLYQSMGRYQAASTIVDSLCDGFEMDIQEIERNTQNGGSSEVQ